MAHLLWEGSAHGQKETVKRLWNMGVNKGLIKLTPGSEFWCRVELEGSLWYALEAALMCGSIDTVRFLALLGYPFSPGFKIGPQICDKLQQALNEEDYGLVRFLLQLVAPRRTGELGRQKLQGPHFHDEPLDPSILH
jgi:hypothetical protein